MKMHSRSGFKNPSIDEQAFFDWTKQLSLHTGRNYTSTYIETSLGKTLTWCIHPEAEETLVIFPGARTTPLIWDLDRGLDAFGEKIRIILVETNGQPNPSDGNTPDIKSNDYGHWAAEVLRELKIEKCYVAGASFGGLVCMKLGMTHPQMIKKAFLLNPGCLQNFSLKWKNLYANLLPIISPTEANVRKFLDAAIFKKPEQCLSPEAEQLLVDYELLALRRYKDKTQKPYFMGSELSEVKCPVYVLLGDHDLLFPSEKSAINARTYIRNLRELQIFPNVAHGIETFAPALKQVAEWMRAQ